jgi:peptidoglycan hydrolase CwlO-like protein
MKNLIILLLVLFSISAFAQYPKLDTDSTGQQIVILTLEQAQALDNSTDILALFESVGAKMGDYDTVCLKVIGEMEEILSSQLMQIGDLRTQVAVKQEKIMNLKSEVAEKDSTIATYQKEIANKNTEIDLHLKEIRNNRLAFGFGGGAVGLIVGVIIGLLAH